MSSFFAKLLEPLRNQRGQVTLPPGTVLEPGDPISSLLTDLGFDPATGVQRRPGRRALPRQARGGFARGTAGVAAGPRRLTEEQLAGDAPIGGLDLGLSPEEAARFDAEVARAARFEREDLVTRLLEAGRPQAAAAAPRRLAPTRFVGAGQGAPVTLGFAPGSAGAQAGDLIRELMGMLTGGDFGGPSRADLLDPRLADIGEQFGAARGRTAERFARLGRSPVSTPQQELQQRLTQREATERQRAIGNVDEFLARLRLNQQTQLQNLLVRLLGIPGIGGQGGQVPRLR